MLRWLNRKQDKKPEVFEGVTSGMKKLYKTFLKPLEEAYKFHLYHSPALDDADFDAKPMILLIGQYSTGKTTFIRYLLEQDFPGMRIGPEPTTDCFIAIMSADKDPVSGRVNKGVIPGNALVVDKTKPFRALSTFGNAFLSRLQCSLVENEVLKSISIIDTPGILSGEKQRVNRGYDFSKVLIWFAERVDRIILLFDAHKLDISDEFQEAINAVKSFDNKIRVVLNKSDQIGTQQLMRVYGALMWSLGKVITTPEVVRVYIGSFWDQPLRYDENRALFEAECSDLFADFQSLPRNATLRKLNDLIMRARLAKVHAYIIGYLYDNMPALFKKEKTKAKLINDLDNIYKELSTKYNISLGDFPKSSKMRKQLETADFGKFRSASDSMIKKVDDMLGKDIAEMMKLIQRDESKYAEKSDEPSVQGGAFAVGRVDNPFNKNFGKGIHAGFDLKDEWVVTEKKKMYDEIFMQLSPVDGKVRGTEAKKEMMRSKLPNTVLAKVWRLADYDRDGFLTEEEFALSMHLINISLEGYPLPDELPDHLVPPSQRGKQRVSQENDGKESFYDDDEAELEGDL